MLRSESATFEAAWFSLGAFAPGRVRAIRRSGCCRPLLRFTVRAAMGDHGPLGMGGKQEPANKIKTAKETEFSP